MKRFMNKKVVAVGLAAGLALGVAGAAFAYFSSTGSGTGSGLVGSTEAVTVNQTGIVYNGPGDAGTDLLPGATATVSFSITNGGGNQYVNAIHLASWTSDKAGCDSTDDPGWITMPDVSVAADEPNGTTAVANQGTITFNDLGVNQDVCQGASLTFSYTSD
jgi:hypothetical protein